MNRSNCKDDLPKNTIQRLMGIFQSINIIPMYTWLESIPGVHSVIVSIPDTTISANGKGSTKELACASGLAELLERLQNLLHFRLSNVYDFSKTEAQKKLYTWGVPKKELSEEEENSWFRRIHTNNSQQLKDALERSTLAKSIYFTKYQNMRNADDVIFVSYEVLDFFYGSNGMAAGNSWDEALVQAISEIVERNVAFQLLSGRNCRTDIFNITEAYLRDYPDMQSKISMLGKKGYTVQILDFSLNNVFPVVGVLFFNRYEQRYFINLGSHPVLDIAVQRAINEFLQGRTPEKIDDMQSFFLSFNKTKFSENLASVFHDGSGVFPASCLDPSAKSEKLPAIWHRNYNNNGEMLQFYKHLLCNVLKKEIYVQYQYSLGFPVVHVLIPSFSEVAPLYDVESLYLISSMHQTKVKYIELCTQGATSEDTVRNLLRAFSNSTPISLNTLFRLPIPMGMNPLNDISTAYIAMCLHLYLEEYSAAYDCAMSHLCFQRKIHPNVKDNRFRVMLSIIYLMSSGYSAEQVTKCFISLGYPEPMVCEYVKQLLPNAVLSLLPQITCPNCDKCELSDLCCFSKEDSILTQITSSNEK